MFSTVLVELMTHNEGGETEPFPQHLLTSVHSGARKPGWTQLQGQHITHKYTLTLVARKIWSEQADVQQAALKMIPDLLLC